VIARFKEFHFLLFFVDPLLILVEQHIYLGTSLTFKIGQSAHANSEFFTFSRRVYEIDIGAQAFNLVSW